MSGLHSHRWIGISPFLDFRRVPYFSTQIGQFTLFDSKHVPWSSKQSRTFSFPDILTGSRPPRVVLEIQFLWYRDMSHFFHTEGAIQLVWTLGMFNFYPNRPGNSLMLRLGNFLFHPHTIRNSLFFEFWVEIPFTVEIHVYSTTTIFFCKKCVDLLEIGVSPTNFPAGNTNTPCYPSCLASCLWVCLLCIDSK